MKISIEKITDQNLDALTQAALARYIGEKCLFCGRTYKTVDDLKDTLWVGQEENRRLACLACWRKYGQNSERASR